MSMTPIFTNHFRLPPEQEAIRAKCFHPAGAFVEFRPEDVEQSITARFEKQVALYPDQIAVKTRRHSLTYAELNRAADRVAQAILDRSDREQQPIALLFENDAPYVTASLGVLKARKIQVSLESTFPLARLRYVLEQSQAAMLVTDNANFSLARQLGDLPVVNIDEIGNRFPAAEIGISVTPDDPVAIAYSSGSTGEPKGMVWNHRGLLHAVMRHTNMSHMCSHDRLVMFRTSFRAYLYALLNGATYYPVDLHQDETPELAEWLIGEKITMYRAAVSAFRSFAGALKGTEEFPHLRLILLFGEPVYHTDVDLYRRQFAEHAILGGTLGCMEFDDYAYFFVDRNSPLPGGVLPGGYPTADAEILLLGDDGRPVGPDQVGEIAIGSRYNPVGYWRRPDLTQAKFLRQAEREDERLYLTGDLGRVGQDGCLFHQGRKDFEIKIHGYRVDVGEVETALIEVEGVKQAVVVGWEEIPGNKRLIAYIVPAETQMEMVTVTELRRILGEKLPDYMIPSAFITLPVLPLTATGKVDRRALPPPDRTRPVLEAAFVAPRSPAEEKLAAIWAAVLGLDRVGVHDSFLELGGDSLSATQVIARVSSEFEVRVPLRLLFDAPTVADMASVIAESAGEKRRSKKPIRSLAEGCDETGWWRWLHKGAVMNNLRSSPDLALVVPFHNEERFLPRLVESLRAQSVQNVPIVFIDNGSTDSSVALIQGCQEVTTGKWTCIEEKTVGKVHAVKTATAFCAQELGVGNVGFLDADSYPDDPAWVRTNVEIINSARGRLGYIYSPIDYFGFDALPVFKRAYLAYEQVLRFLVANVGWLANGQGFVCSVDVLKKYFRDAEVTTEFDLRCSLLALSQGRSTHFNPGLLISSSRRMIVNAQNFAAWCFYEREFYSKKDINAREKLNLNSPAPVDDLPYDKVDEFFRRRAMKIACRHVIPLAIFDGSSYYLERAKTVLGLDIAAKLNPTTRRLPENIAYLFTNEFETMIKLIERDPATIALANCLEELMRGRYNETASLPRHAGRSNGVAQTGPERRIPLDDDARQHGWAMRDIAQTHLQLYKQLRRQEKSEKDLARIHRAYELATNLYSGYYQADGKPFVTHSVGVASILAHLGLDAEFVAAGLLHNIYDNGDFGDGRRKVITRARRGLVRNAVGDDIEALIDRFRAFRILPATIDEIWRRLDQFNQTERNLIVMDLADHLEKYQDGGVFYFGDNHWVVDFVHQYGDRLTAIAMRLGEPKFAAMLREAFEQPPDEVPRVLRTSRKYLELIVPMSCRRRVYPVLRRRLNRGLWGWLLRQLPWLPGKQAAGMR